MKKIVLFAFLVFFSLGAFSIMPDSKSKSENPGVPVKKEYKMSDEEINRLTKRDEVLRGLDKSQQTVIVQEEHGRRNRRGHDGMYRDNPRHSSSVVFVGGGAVLVLIILLIILV
jgi:hypothetical protein